MAFPKFSLERVATPSRTSESDAPRQPANKLPKLSNLTIEAGPRPPPPQRMSLTADVQLCIYKYTEDASAIWDDVKEDGVSLWQVQLKHDAYDSVVVNLYEKFNHFLATHDDDAVPKSLAELQRRAFIKLITTDAQDPDGAGTFRRWRTAFYVAGPDVRALRDFLYVLDEFWFSVSAERQTDVTVCLHPHIGIDIAPCWDKFEYETYTLHEPAKILPVGIFEAHPVQGRRILMMTLQIESDEKLSIVLFGATWFFRDRFDAFGVPGYRREGADGEPSTYYRVLESVDASLSDETDRVFKMLGNGVLKQTAVRVSIDGALKPGTSVFQFVQKLRQCSNLYFS